MDASQQQRNMTLTRQTRMDSGFFSPPSFAAVVEEAVVVVAAAA